MKATIIAVLLSLFSASANAGGLTPLQSFGMFGYRPYLPVTGPGPFTNLGDGDGATTNAMAHIGWSLAIPLLGEKIGGTKGKWIAGLSWIALSIAQEWLFHAPANPDPHYPAEVRTDLITRIVPTICILAW